MGTPAFAVPSLAALALAGDVTLVVTRPDRPRGRGRELQPSEIGAEAARRDLPVWKPATLRGTDAVERLRAERADVFAVVAYGAILPADVLAVPRAGAINLHGSLLPDYRGASPVQAALWDGLAETGVSTMFLDDGLDTGDVILSQREAIRDDDDAGTLAARLASIGAPLLAESVALAHDDRAPRTPQDRTAGRYAKKLKKDDGRIDWTLDADTIWHHARAVTPWPGAATVFAGRRLSVLASRPVETTGQGAPGTVLGVEREGIVVACGQRALRVERVKAEGRAAMHAGDWARGARVAVGDRFLEGVTS